jgi:beta-lactamase superfamily II metal-dependent hydrolase
MRKRLALLFLFSTWLPASAAGLRIAAVDVEGGGALLLKTPEGRSLLIDTGWAPGQGGPRAAGLPTSAERIAEAARTLDIHRIDYLVMTHYHADHLGGLEALLARMSVDTFIDHGANREPMRADPTPQQRINAPAARYPAWVAAWQGHRHLSITAGDTLDIGSLHIRFVASDGEVVKSPLPGAGKPNPACADVPPPPRLGGEENNRSLGLLMTFGRTRMIDLGDLTWEKEIALLCPVNKVGPVDIYFVTGHGMALSGSPPTAALTPQVAIMQNGPLKGGDASVIRTIDSYPGLKGFWRSHDTARYPELNGDPDYVANREGEPDRGHAIMVDVTAAGRITVTNTRNGFSRRYSAR